MGPEHSEWLHETEPINAADLVQDYLDSLGPQDRPAAGEGRPAQSNPSLAEVGLLFGGAP